MYSKSSDLRGSDADRRDQDCRRARTIPLPSFAVTVLNDRRRRPYVGQQKVIFVSSSGTLRDPENFSPRGVDRSPDHFDQIDRRRGRSRVLAEGRNRFGGAANRACRPAGLGRVARPRPGGHRDVGTQRGTYESVRRDPVDRIPGPRLGLRDRDRATVNASDALADYVLGLARQIIAPRGRGNIGFDQPVPVSDDVSLLDRLIAFTGRQPVS
jgi:hypothetical protein